MTLRDVTEFESQLDRELEARSLLKMEPVEAITDCAGSISASYSRLLEKPAAYALAHRLIDGFSVALPYLIRADRGGKLDFQTLFEDLIFMSHYYSLRELLYYTYNAPGSISWEFDRNQVLLEFRDMSIPTQFAYGWSSWIAGSTDLHDSMDRNDDRIHELLQGAAEFGDGDHIQEVFRLISIETDAKLTKYFELLGGSSSTIQLSGYAYSTFYAVYRHLLTKALYHRYFAMANGTWATFQFPKRGLVQEISSATGLDNQAIISVLEDLSYSQRNSNLPPMYFSLIDHAKSSKYLMIPHQVAWSDGLIQLLRVQAIKSPGHFSRSIGRELGHRFAMRVASSFREAGFLVKTNVSLSVLDAAAPDIDVLVVSREATLGYCVFICEVKATLPALWAKDHLRALRADSIPKAFEQLRRINAILATEVGQRFLVEQIVSLDPSPPDDGLIAVHSLVITSQNAGMFFQEETKSTRIIDDRTLARILSRCDGDVVYLLQALRELPRLFGESYEQIWETVKIGERTVTYPAAAIKSIVDFDQNEWKSTGLDVKVAQEFFEAGHSPFDVLKELDDRPSGEQTSDRRP